MASRDDREGTIAIVVPGVVSVALAALFGAVLADQDAAAGMLMRASLPGGATISGVMDRARWTRPFIIRLPQQGADAADDGVVVGEDAGRDPGAAVSATCRDWWPDTRSRGSGGDHSGRRGCPSW